MFCGPHAIADLVEVVTDQDCVEGDGGESYPVADERRESPRA